MTASSAIAIAETEKLPGRQSLSLVDLVEKAYAEGATGEVPRISLVDLVGSSPNPDQATAPASTDAAPGSEELRQHPQRPVAVSASPAEPERTPVVRVPASKPPLRVVEQAEAEPLQAVVLPAPAATASSLPRAVHGSAAASAVAVARQAGEDVVPLAAEVEVPRVTNTRRAAPLSLALPPSMLVDLDGVQAADAAQLLDLPVLDSPSNKTRLADAVRSALNEHPAIVESLARLDSQHEQVSVAKAGYWPQLRSGINTGYRHSTGRSEEALSVSASQMVYDFGKVSSSVDVAARGVDREEAGVLLAAEDLIRDTARAFLEARRYEVLLGLAHEQVEAISELEALAAKRSAMGASTASDEMQARSRREAAKATQLQLQAQRDQWHRALENLTGSRHPLTLDEAYPEPLEGVCMRLPEHFENSPRVVIAEAERAEAEAAIRQARAEQRPTLSLNADFEHYLNSDRGGLQQRDDQEFVVSLNLTSNLFQGGALRARTRAAVHAFDSATAARDKAQLELSRLYRETRDRSRSLSSSLALQDDRYGNIVKTQELYRHQYLSLGTRTLLDILNTEQEIFQTQLDKNNTLFDLRSLQIDCLYSVGGLRDVFRAGEVLNYRVESRRAEERS